mmetsp:Transcript_7523/g.13271  ORF Transcript_7523/g.13271 Transcript_7523/m.13271 type:complete len:100 (-) Transcript_7523:66-365(-)
MSTHLDCKVSEWMCKVGAAPGATGIRRCIELSLQPPAGSGHLGVTRLQQGGGCSLGSWCGLSISCTGGMGCILLDQALPSPPQPTLPAAEPSVPSIGNQ